MEVRLTFPAVYEAAVDAASQYNLHYMMSFTPFNIGRKYTRQLHLHHVAVYYVTVAKGAEHYRCLPLSDKATIY